MRRVKIRTLAIAGVFALAAAPCWAPIIILKPIATPSSPWEFAVDEGSGQRAATFGDSMEISEDFGGPGAFGLLAKIGWDFEEATRLKLKVKDSKQNVRIVEAELQLGQLAWKVDGYAVSTCTDCPDLPAEFEGDIIALSGSGGTFDDEDATEARASKEP